MAPFALLAHRPFDNSTYQLSSYCCNVCCYIASSWWLLSWARYQFPSRWSSWCSFDWSSHLRNVSFVLHWCLLHSVNSCVCFPTASLESRICKPSPIFSLTRMIVFGTSSLWVELFNNWSTTSHHAHSRSACYGSSPLIRVQQNQRMNNISLFKAFSCPTPNSHISCSVLVSRKQLRELGGNYASYMELPSGSLHPSDVFPGWLTRII